MHTNGVKDSIVQKTINLILQKGTDFTVQDIAEELHISKKTVYSIFDSKEKICEKALEVIYKNIIECKYKVINSECDLLEKIRCILVSVPEEYQNCDFTKVFEVIKEYPSLYNMNLEFDEACWGPLDELVLEGQKLGIIRDFSLNVFKTMVDSCLYTFMGNEPIKGFGGKKQLMDEMSRMFIESIMVK